jgi:hypothetical protein
MIWFACKQCGKRHGRAESLSGTLVFCECGHGNRVPWSSTAAEPEESSAPIPLPLPPPEPARARPRQATPIPFLDEDEPRPGRPAEPLPPPFRSKPKREYRRVNPKYCLNHDELPTEHTCSQCRLPFCSKCVLTLQDEVLCGPCKNFKVRGMQRPTRLTPLAILAAVLGVAAGMMSFCLSLVGGASQAQSAGGGLVAAVFGLVALLPPGGALVMSFYALHEIESKPRVGGRALAMTGTVASLVGLVWTVNVILIIIIKGVQSL